MKGHTDVVRLQLEKGANTETMRSDTGSTVLYWATCNEYVGLVRLLLGKGANSGAMRSGIGVTPRYQAARNGHTEVEDANTEVLRSHIGVTPKGLIPTIRVLLVYEANVCRKMTMCRNSESRDPVRDKGSSCFAFACRIA